MATLESLREAVKTTVDDPSLDDEIVDELINEAILDIAEEVLLPDLEASAVFTTEVDATVIALPVDFGRNLYGCGMNGYAKQPNVLSSMALMQDRYPSIEADNESGDVEYVCTRGSELVYHPVPAAAEGGVIRYYRAPTPLAEDGDIPTYIPPRMQRPLILAYVCQVLFDDIEDGVEGAKVNTLKHENNYAKALLKLEQSVKQGQSRPGPPKGGNQWM